MIQAHHQVSGSSMGIHSLIRCGGMHLLSTYYEPASENRLLGHFHYLSARVTKVGNHNKVGRINQIRSSLKYVIYSPSGTTPSARSALRANKAAVNPCWLSSTPRPTSRSSLSTTL